MYNVKDCTGAVTQREIRHHWLIDIVLRGEVLLWLSVSVSVWKLSFRTDTVHRASMLGMKAGACRLYQVTEAQFT